MIDDCEFRRVELPAAQLREGLVSAVKPAC
jgi:hypothetical protein